MYMLMAQNSHKFLIIIEDQRYRGEWVFYLVFKSQKQKINWRKKELYFHLDYQPQKSKCISFSITTMISMKFSIISKD